RGRRIGLWSYAALSSRAHVRRGIDEHARPRSSTQSAQRPQNLLTNKALRALRFLRRASSRYGVQRSASERIDSTFNCGTGPRSISPLVSCSAPGVLVRVLYLVSPLPAGTRTPETSTLCPTFSSRTTFPSRISA